MRVFLQGKGDDGTTVSDRKKPQQPGFICEMESECYTPAGSTNWSVSSTKPNLEIRRDSIS